MCTLMHITYLKIRRKYENQNLVLRHKIIRNGSGSHRRVGRMEILRYLLLNGRSDIGSISENLPQDRSVISRHLQLMLDSGLLHCEKETRFRYYSINGGNFINKLEATAFQLRKCMSVCCPECLEPDVISKEQLNKQDSE